MYHLPWKINLYIKAVEWSFRDSECTTGPDAHSVQLYGHSEILNVLLTLMLIRYSCTASLSRALVVLISPVVELISN